MLSRLRIFAAASFTLLIGACFLSDRPLIGEGVHLQDGPLAFCMEAGERCHSAVAQEDGYLLLPHPEDAAEEDPIFLRFMPLMRAGSEDIWLGEADLSDRDDGAWAYVVARREGLTQDGVTEYAVAVPICNEASDSQRIRFGLERQGVHACTVSNLEAFAEYLVERHGRDFADGGWWEAAN